tara:strand:+ start:686 stop:949 length:264 start_codon:yes stop_codon:yes gene_type:complete
LKITIGMPEFLLLGSFYLYQQAFAFSMVLLGMALFGKLLSYGNEIQQKKQSAEAGKELTQNIMDSLMNAVTLSGIAHGTKSKKNGYH